MRTGFLLGLFAVFALAEPARAVFPGYDGPRRPADQVCRVDPGHFTFHQIGDRRLIPIAETVELPEGEHVLVVSLGASRERSSVPVSCAATHAYRIVSVPTKGGSLLEAELDPEGVGVEEEWRDPCWLGETRGTITRLERKEGCSRMKGPQCFVLTLESGFGEESTFTEWNIGPSRALMKPKTAAQRMAAEQPLAGGPDLYPFGTRNIKAGQSYRVFYSSCQPDTIIEFILDE